MSQEDIRKLFSKDKSKWWRTDEIAEKLKQGKSSITTNLQKMRNWGEVERRIFQRERGQWRVEYKLK